MSRKKVQRIADWDDARYSVLPARVALDGRLTIKHYRVLAYLGRVNTRDGWCEFSQKAAANVLGIGRQAINGAVTDLVEWKYVERKGQKETKSALCQYRVKIDEDVSSGDDTPRVASEATHVSSQGDTRVASSSDTLLRSKIKDQKRNDLRSFERQKPRTAPSGIRDTSEPFSAYHARMIREGKARAN